MIWYPTLPELLRLHERVCALREVSAGVDDMSAIDAALLAPQRTGAEQRDAQTIAVKMVALLRPLLVEEPFTHCGDRVAFALAQRFADRNGFILQAPMNDLEDQVRDTLPDSEATDTASWIEARLETRFDASHTDRVFGALNTLADVKASLERVPGFHEEVDRIDSVGFGIAHQIATLIRLDEASKQNIEERFPVFAEAWREALEIQH
jgi:prophage maintenance system killer protein